MGHDHDHEADRSEPSAAVGAPAGFRAPTFGQRLLGRLIDTVVLMVVVGVTTLLAGDRTATIVGILVVAAYEIVLVALRGQTVGKMVMGTCVVDRESGALPYLGQATTRWLVVIAGSVVAMGFPLLEPVVPIYTLVVLVPILLAPLHRGLHDRASGTIVTALVR